MLLILQFTNKKYLNVVQGLGAAMSVSQGSNCGHNTHYGHNGGSVTSIMGGHYAVLNKQTALFLFLFEVSKYSVGYTAFIAVM
jgi:hypothetical protein